MNIEVLRNYVLSMPDVIEGFPFGDGVIVFKVLEKVFLLIPLDTGTLQFNAKCDPEKAIRLREEYSSIQPGYHMNKKHWNTVVVDGSIPSRLIREMINDSYGLVAGKNRNKK